MKSKKISSKTLIYAILVFGCVISMFPFFWLIRSSFMSSEEIFAMPMVLFPSKLRFENYSEALTVVPFGRYLVNTVILIVLNISGNIFSSSMAAFGFSRINFKGRNFIFALVISTMMIPSTVLYNITFFWCASFTSKRMLMIQE